MSSEIPAWRRWAPRVATVSATFTALCCLGVTAALSLATAVGATFMTTDETLQPLLAVMLVLTAAGSLLTLLGHRNPLPLILTVASGALVFFAIFGSSLFAAHEEASTHGGGGGGHSGGNIWAWSGLVVLIAVQVWDFWLVRSRRRRLVAAA